MKQMMIYNTLSRKKEPFVPVHPKLYSNIKA